MTTTTEKNISKIKLGDVTIARDYDRLSLQITKPSPRSRMGFKYLANYSFRSLDAAKSTQRMDAFVNKFITDLLNDMKAKEAKKAAIKTARTKFVNPHKVGDILFNSWGYDQTNVDFYQVVSVEGKTVVVRAIAKMAHDTGDMCGKCSAVKDSFIGEEIKKVVQIRVAYNSTEAHTYINRMSPWDGMPKYYSSYH